MSRRDEQLRKSMLDLARISGGASAGQWVALSRLAIGARDRDGDAVRDEAHAEALVLWLIEQGLLEEKSAQPTGGDKRDIRHRQVRLTEKGFKLWTGEIDPIPGVADRKTDD